ncbi:MAG: cytochrome P460 family protein [Cyanobacteria bacterium P01_H01_bin.21]
MTRSRWILGLVFVLISAGVAIALNSLTPSDQPMGYGLGYDYSPASDMAVSAEVEPVQFPADYQQQFVQYATVDCPNNNIVRKMYVNRPSLEALDASETVPSGTVLVMETHSAQQGSDNRLTPTRLNNVFIREKRDGWRVNADSGEWRSAWYSPSGSLVSRNQGSCIGCHTMVRDRDYLFTLPALLTAAKTNQMQYQTTEFGTSVCR